MVSIFYIAKRLSGVAAQGNTVLYRKSRRNAMSVSVDVENTRHNYQKPPLSVGRIAGEILAGTATGATAAAIAYLFFYAVGYGAKIAGLSEGGCMPSLADLAIWGITLWVVPMAYGLASAVGVYLVGSRGTQTGSFLASLGFGLIGGFVMMVALIPVAFLSAALIVGAENIARRTLWVLVALIPPISATLGFNLTRRYKQQDGQAHQLAPTESP